MVCRAATPPAGAQDPCRQRGGQQQFDDKSASDQVWVCDVNSPSPAGELSEGRRAFWAHSAGGQILLFGGYTDVFSPAVQVYEPRTGTLRAASRLPQGVADAKFLPIRGRWYTAGGEVGIKIRGRHTWEGVAG